MNSCHSRLSEDFPIVCDIPIMPINNDPKDGVDIIDEAIEYFRYMVFFKNYNIEKKADKVLAYLTLFIQKLIGILKKFPDKKDLDKELRKLKEERILGPGDTGFVLEMYVEKGKQSENEKVRDFLYKIRVECTNRLLKRCSFY